MNFLVGNGFGAMMTCIRDRLPEEIEANYFPQKTYSSDNTKVARLFYPVAAINNTEEVSEKRTCDDGEEFEHVIRKYFQCVHV